MQAHGRVLLLASALVLGGCLEGTTEEQEPPPIPQPPPIDEGTLFSGVLVGGGLTAFRVPEGAAALEVLALPTLTSGGELTLRDPLGVERGACSALPCDVGVDAPAAGNWTLEYSVGAEVHVRVELAVEEKPDDPEDPNGTRDLLYEGSLDPSFTASPGSEEHMFHVAPGYADLVVAGASVDADASGRFALVDPSGEVRATCGGSTTCEAIVASPTTGLWRARHHADGSSGRWQIEAYGVARATVAPPSNYSAFEDQHTYSPAPGTNVTTGFYVREGHRSLIWGASFRGVDLQTEEPRPIAVLRAPNGTMLARCQPGAGWDCPGQHAAAAGLWRVQYLGPATGEVEAEVFVFGPAAPPPTPSPEPTPAPTPPSPGFPRERYLFQYNTWPGAVGPRHDHVPFLSTAGTLRGEIGPGVLLRDPGGEEVMRCQREVCPVDLVVGWAGTWIVEYPDADNGFANLTFDEGVDGAAAVSGEGRYYTAIDRDIVRFPADAIQRIFIPPGWTFIDGNVTIEASDDDRATRVDLRDPSASAATCFAWKSPCAMRVSANAGQHGIELHGGISRAHVRLVVS